MSGYEFTNAGTTYDDEDPLTGYQRTNGSLSQSWNLTSVGDWNSVTTNGTAQNRTHGPTHELLTADGQNVSTDVKGNITLLPAVLASGLSPQASCLTYDFDNNLKSVDFSNNSSTDVEYKYDALGRRVARVGNSGSYVYVQSDQQTIADYGVGDAPSAPLYRYVYASFIDEPVVRKGAGNGGTIHYYHRTQQYSITAVTTSAGAIAERYAYSAYGEPTILDGSGTAISSSTINNRYSYTGREWDATVGLHHFRARWMSPKSGRFMGRDPIGYKGSQWSLNESLRSRPTKMIDPLGLKWSIPNFLGHYFYGFGAPIDLANVGLAETYWNHPMIQDGLNELESKLLGGIRRQFFPVKCPGGGAFSTQLDYAVPVDFSSESSGLYVLGRGSLQISASCSGVKICTKCCSFTAVTCDITVFQKDFFQDPLDFDDWIGIPIDLLYSNPYSISTSIHGSYSNARYECTDGTSATTGSGFQYDFDWTNPMYL